MRNHRLGYVADLQKHCRGRERERNKVSMEGARDLDPDYTEQ